MARAGARQVAAPIRRASWTVKRFALAGMLTALSVAGLAQRFIDWDPALTIVLVVGAIGLGRAAVPRIATIVTFIATAVTAIPAWFADIAFLNLIPIHMVVAHTIALGVVAYYRA
jgi:hypothetical protein